MSISKDFFDFTMDSLTKYKNLDPFQLKDNIFDLLDNQWMLITAGNALNFNAMTASWGGFGVLWNKPVATIYIRPQRYTYQFVESSLNFNLAFFDEKYRKTLSFMGSKSGRDFNKPKETGLTPTITPCNNISFAEARLIIDCKKLYFGDLQPENFVESSLIEKIYPTKDFHRFYIGEITGCYLIG